MSERYRVQVEFAPQVGEADAAIFVVKASTAMDAEKRALNLVRSYHPGRRIACADVVPVDTVDHWVSDDGHCNEVCPACRENMRRGLNPDGTVPEPGDNAPLAVPSDPCQACNDLGTVGPADVPCFVCQRPEPALAPTKMTDEQRYQVARVAGSLTEGCVVREVLEYALCTDRPLEQVHDFGPHGDARYCRRSGCKARNHPPANRWACRGSDDQ